MSWHFFHKEKIDVNQQLRKGTIFLGRDRLKNFGTGSDETKKFRTERDEKFWDGDEKILGWNGAGWHKIWRDGTGWQDFEIEQDEKGVPFETPVPDTFLFSCTRKNPRYIWWCQALPWYPLFEINITSFLKNRIRGNTR